MNIILFNVKVRIELSIRSADISEILDDENAKNVKNSKKSFLFLFNEYKLVLESILFQNSIPFKYSSEPIKDLTFYSKFHSNIDDALNRS
jgi:hypothetical protein